MVAHQRRNHSTLNEMEDLTGLEDLIEPSDPQPSDDYPTGVTVFPIPTAMASAKKKPAREELPALARSYAERYNVDPDIFERQIRQESGFNQFARSPKGALGLTQFMPATGRRYGLTKRRDFFDPDRSLDAGARHMRDLLDANNNDYDLALAAYNAGQEAVNKHGGIPPYKETRNYIRTIRGSIARQPNPLSGIEDLIETSTSQPDATAIKQAASPLEGIEDLLEPSGQQPVAPTFQPQEMPLGAIATPQAGSYPIEPAPGAAPPPQMPQNAQPNIYDLFSDVLGLSPDAQQLPPDLEPIEAGPGEPPPSVPAGLLNIADIGQPPAPQAARSRKPTLRDIPALKQELAARQADLRRQAFAAKYGGAVQRQDHQAAVDSYNQTAKQYNGLVKRQQQHAQASKPSSELLDRAAADIGEFEAIRKQAVDLKAQGDDLHATFALRQAFDKAAQIRDRYGKHVEVGTGQGGWPYIKPVGWQTTQPAQPQKTFAQAALEGGASIEEPFVAKPAKPGEAPEKSPFYQPTEQIIQGQAMRPTDGTVVKTAEQERAQRDETNRYLFQQSEADRKAALRYHQLIAQKEEGAAEDEKHYAVTNAIRHGVQHLLAGVGESTWSLGTKLAQTSPLGMFVSAIRPETDKEISDFRREMIETAEDVHARNRPETFMGAALYQAGKLLPKLAVPGGPIGFGVAEVADALGHDATPEQAVGQGLKAIATAQLGGMLGGRLSKLAERIPATSPARPVADYFARSAGYAAAPAAIGAVTEGKLPDKQQAATDLVFGLVFALHGSKWHYELDPNEPPSWFKPALNEAGRLAREAGLDSDQANAFVDKLYSGAVSAVKNTGVTPRQARGTVRDLARDITGELKAAVQAPTGKKTIGRTEGPVNDLDQAGLETGPRSLGRAGGELTPIEEAEPTSPPERSLGRASGPQRDLEEEGKPPSLAPAGAAEGEGQRIIQQVDTAGNVITRVVGDPAGELRPPPPPITGDDFLDSIFGTRESLPKSPKETLDAIVERSANDPELDRALSEAKSPNAMRRAIQERLSDLLDKAKGTLGFDGKVGRNELNRAVGSLLTQHMVADREREKRGAGPAATGDVGPAKTEVVEPLAISKTTASELAPGDVVSHPAFAKGQPMTVEQIAGDGTLKLRLEREDGSSKIVNVSPDSRVGRELKLETKPEQLLAPIQKPIEVAPKPEARPRFESYKSGDRLQHPNLAGGAPLKVIAVANQGRNLVLQREDKKGRPIKLLADSPTGKGLQRIGAVDQAAHEAATSPQNNLAQPSAAQIEAGNYTKGHVQIGGLSIAIENPEGSKRKPEWPTLKSHYGYIKRTEGGDGEHIDVFVKPGTPEGWSGPVFVVDQQNKDGRFDEHKVMLGFSNEADARRGYSENYTKGWKVGPVREFANPQEFRDWLETADTTKPASEVGVKYEQPIKQISQPAGGARGAGEPAGQRPDASVAGSAASGVALTTAEKTRQAIERRKAEKEAIKQKAQERIEAAKTKNQSGAKEQAAPKPLTAQKPAVLREITAPLPEPANKISGTETPAEKRRRIAEDLKRQFAEMKQKPLEELTPKGWTIAETALKPMVEDQRAAFRFRDGYLALNSAGLRAIGRAYGRTIRGITVTAKQARKVAADATELAAQTTGIESDNLARLSAALMDAASRSEEFAIIRPTRRMRDTARHEFAHVAQLALRRFFDAAPPRAEVEKLKHYQLVAEGLAKKGYTWVSDPRTIAHEAAAHIIGGQWDQLRITFRQAEEFVYDYFKLIGRTYKADALKRFDRLSERLKGLRDAALKNIRAEEARYFLGLGSAQRSVQEVSGRRATGDSSRDGQEQAGQVFGDLAPEDIPLPEPIKQGLAEIARTFIEEGRTNFDELIAEFEELLGDELFDEVADYLPLIVAAEEAGLQEQHEAETRKIDTSAESARRQELSAPRPPGFKTSEGAATSIIIPGSNREIPARYQARELDDVHPSHNPQNFQPNPSYELVNDRRYDREKAYQQEIIANSTKQTFKPQSLINNSDTAEVGPPVIDQNGNVLGGNSRTMMLARIYAAGAGNDYKAELLRQASVYELSVKELAMMKRPVLVREITDETLSRQQAVTDLNVTGTRALTPQERAAAEAGKMPDATVDYLAQKIDAAGDDATLAQVLDRSGVEITNRLIDDGVFQPQERNGLIKDGELLPEAKARIQRMMMGRIFRDLDQLNRAPDSIKRNMERIIAPMIRIEAIPEWGILDELRTAIDLVTEAVATGQAGNLDEFARQPSMFRPRDYTSREVAIAHTLQLGVVKTARAFRKYTNEGALAERGGGLFGSATPAEAFAQAFKAKEETSKAASIEAAPPDYGSLDRPNASTLSRAFEQDFTAGRSFSSIVEARKRASDLLGGEVKPGTPAAKTVDEAVELGVVRAARRIVAEGGTEPQTYDRLVKLYSSQPTLGTKTSTSVRNQAYSTPVPIAYVASRLAGINRSTSTYEPTAGNGMLLIEAEPDNITANELNPERAANLRDSLIDADVTEQDASELVPARAAFDVVIANPPFGVVRNEAGESKIFQIDAQYRTTEIDHAIALKALEAIKDDGRAVLIVGGINAVDEKARSDGYNGKAKRAFYYTLYHSYNVVDHFTVAGDLYTKQGAGWPVDVIVIDGRGKSGRALPAVDVPRIYDSFDALKGALNASYRKDQLGATRQPAATGARSDRGGQGTGTRPVSIPEPTRGSAGSPSLEGAQPADGAERSLSETSERGTGGIEAGSGAGGREPDLQQSGRAGETVAQGDTGAAAEETRSARRESATTDQADQSQPVGESPARPARRAEQVKDVTRTQIPYQPHSAQPSAGTLVPVNMVTATDEALSRLERQVGSLDEYVADELGYLPAEIGRYFNAEQVDALALAIRAMQTGAGFIIGDQTGIGKGRVVAGVIRYALRTSRTPIFVTEKPNLYKDIYRDLIDIGMTAGEVRPMMTNAGERLALTDDESVILRSKQGPDHRKELQRQAHERNLGDSNIIFTTYSQMQTVKGARTARMDFLDAFAQGGVLILDESHNAGGAEVKDRGKAGTEGMNRAKFTRQLVSKASGVFYSSATYAKRPQVMDLYSKTDMRLAVKTGGLAEAIEKGGVPLQQAVASQLVESGQYIRRERSFEGVTYNTKSVNVDKRTAENIAAVMRAIRSFDNAKQAAVEALKKEAKAEAKALLGETATGAAGVHSTNFTSLMHNLVDQMLLGLKADAAVDEALAAMRRGEKAVITVANTMGSFIEHYVEENDLKPGDAIGLNFGDMLLRYLERSRDVLVGNAFGHKERKRLTDAQLGDMGVEAYKRTRKLIEQTDWSRIPVSPIDYIKSKIEAEGYHTGEITGRQHTIDYKGDTAVYRMRAGALTSIAGRNRAITKFNNGETDVMVLNQAGATGLSLHASEKFRDQRKRHMIIAQAERNIDTHMQMLGRVHRTGQVVLPEYTQLAADIPAEKRPAAILAKKMASLNANTTAARGSAVTAKDVTDFMNDYGDELVAGLMNDNPDLHAKLGNPLSNNQDGEGLQVEGAIRKVTGRIPLLKIAEQEELYNLIESEYNDLIARLDAMGENALEAKTVDLDARPIKKTVVFEGKGDRPFERSAHAEVMDVKLIGKPYSSEEVLSLLNEHFGTEGKDLEALQDEGESASDAMQEQIRKRFREYKREVVDEIEEEDRRRAKETMLNAQAGRLEETLNALPIGATVKLEADEAVYFGIVTNVEQKGSPKNPVALGSWKVTFAVADSMRRLTLPVSQINGQGERQVTVKAQAETEGLFRVPIIDFFDKSQQQSREQRTIITGNLLAGFGRFKAGRIVNFTDAEGAVRSGILMPRDWSVEKAIDDEPVEFASAEHILSFLDATNALARSSDRLFSISKRGQDYRFYTPASKAQGGRYFLDQPLIRAAGKDFVKSGDMMQVFVDRATAARIIDTAHSQGVVFQAESFKDKAREITGKPKRSSEAMEEIEPQAFEDIEPSASPITKKRKKASTLPAASAARGASGPVLSGVMTAGVKAGWDKFLNLSVRNLSHLRRVSPESHTAALRAGGSRGQATVLLSLATAKINKALEGSGIAWKDVRAALVESRLRGVRERYQDWATSLRESDDEELINAINDGGLFNILANIEGRAGFDDTLAQRAAALYEMEDLDSLRDFMAETFDLAADRTGRMMDDDDFERITENRKFKPALHLYIELIEKPIAESHALNEGIFSEALGPLDTYYPLVAVKDDGGILHRIFGGTKYPYRKPRNIANYFATGLAEHGYSTEMEDFSDRIRAAIRTNNKANLLSELDRRGLIRVLGPKEKAPEEAYLGGAVAPVNTVETRADLLVVRDGKQARVPAARAIIPVWLEKELKPILDKEKIEPGMGDSLINKVIEASLIGPFDLIFHATNVLGSLVANTPFVGKSIFGKTVGNLPMTKWITAILRTIQTDPTSEQGLKDLIEMANLGLIPPRYGTVATAWRKAGREYARQTGAKTSYFSAPLLYGQKGLDVRARLVMYRVAKEINQKATPQQLFDFVTQLGVYNRELESQIERWAKATRLAPFATAGTTMLRNGLNAWLGPLGTQPIPAGGGTKTVYTWKTPSGTNRLELPGGGDHGGGGGLPPGVPPDASVSEEPGGGGAGKRFAYRLASYLSGGAAGLVLMWALAYREYKKKWPWEDPEARLLQIPLNEADRNSKLGILLYGPDPTKTAYVNFAFFSPLVARGSRSLGISGALETGQLGGSGGQALEYAQRDIYNSIAHPFVSGPLVRAPFVFLTGKEPQLTSFRDMTGQFGPQFYPATVKAAPGLPSLGRRAEEALLNINPFFQAGAAVAGVGHQGEDRPNDQRPARWLRMITDVAAPRLLGSSVDTLKKRQQLEKERKASTSEPATEARLPDDVRMVLHKAGVIPTKPPRKPGESDADYLKRSEGAGEEITARVRAIASTDIYKSMDQAARTEMLKTIIKDARHDESLAAKRDETEKEGELLTARSIAEDQARARLTESDEFKALNEDRRKKALAEMTKYFTKNFELEADERKLSAEIRAARAGRRLIILDAFVKGGRIERDVQRILIEVKKKAA